jgi:hypothetical protein
MFAQADKGVDISCPEEDRRQGYLHNGGRLGRARASAPKTSGMGAASCQRIFEHLGTAVLDELDSRPHSVEEIREYEPEIRLLVKLRHAVEADVAFQGNDAGQQAAALPHRKKGNRWASSKGDLLSNRRAANN